MAINVRCRGAVGDGSADDSAAFAASLESGESIFVPAGTYRVGGIDIPACGRVDIFGEAGAVLIGSDREKAFLIRTTAGGGNSIRLADIKVAGYVFPIYEGEQCSHAVASVTVERCWFKDCQYAVHLRCLVDAALLRDNIFTDIGASATQLAAAPKNHVGCIWLGNGDVPPRNTGAWVVDRNHAARVFSAANSGEAETHFLLALSGYDVLCRDNVVADLSNENVGGAEGIYFKNVIRGVISGNYLMNAGHGVSDGVVTLKGYCRDVMVAGNVFVGAETRSYPIDRRQRAALIRGRNITFSSNHLTGFYAASVVRAMNDYTVQSENVTFRDNVFHDPGAESIYRIDATGSGISIDGDKVAGIVGGFSPTTMFAMLRHGVAGGACDISNVDYAPSGVRAAVVNQHAVNTTGPVHIDGCRMTFPSAAATRVVAAVSGEPAVPVRLTANRVDGHTAETIGAADTTGSAFNSWDTPT